MKKYLWVYQNMEGSSFILFGTFITESDAKNMFGGKFSYRRLSIKDIELGI